MTQNPSKDINKSIYVQKDMSQQNYLSLYEDDTIDLFDLFLIIWNWKWLIILIFILGTVGSYGVTSILPKTYESSVLFLTEDENALKRVVSNPKLIYEIVKNENLTDIILKGSTIDKNYNSEISREEQATALLLSKNSISFNKEVYEFNSSKPSGNIKGEIKLNSLPDFSVFYIQHPNPQSTQTLSNLLPELLNQYSINSEQEFYLKERLKLQKQLGDIRGSQEKILLEITDLTQKGVTTFNLVEGGNGINIMTQLKLRLGEKLADKALAFASNKQERYQKIIKEIEALQNEIFLQENLIKESETHGVKIKGKQNIFEGLISQESELLEKKQQIEQKILDLKNRRVEILSSATLPESPIKPKTRLIVAISAVVSLFVGIFLVFVIEFIKNAKSRLKENEEGLSPA